ARHARRAAGAGELDSAGAAAAAGADAAGRRPDCVDPRYGRRLADAASVQARPERASPPAPWRTCQRGTAVAAREPLSANPEKRPLLRPFLYVGATCR